jgi:Glycosyltransferase family 10 (fucosyltransferase) C-term
MIKVFKSGAHAHRTPLSYPALAPLFADTIDLIETPQQADIYLFAHTLDVEAAPRALIEDWRARRRPVVVLSEEPFWDTIWGRKPLARNRVLDTRFGALPVIQLNHHTSDIFTFDKIPYYLLSNHRFANTYTARFARNAALSGTDWQARFAARSVDLTFMFERRPESYHTIRWPEGGIIGLCSWRTKLAEACTTGTVERLGQSWQGGRTRFELKNWHRDKMTRLDDHTRILGAFENTHQPGYITEKLFDAFACGALPLYFASPHHRIHTFDLPPESWVNLFDLAVPEAAERIAQMQFTPRMFEAYAQAQNLLARLFCDPAAWVSERHRLAHAVLRSLQQVLDGV